jgi:hypothetical protein
METMDTYCRACGRIQMPQSRRNDPDAASPKPRTLLLWTIFVLAAIAVAIGAALLFG